MKTEFSLPAAPTVRTFVSNSINSAYFIFVPISVLLQCFKLKKCEGRKIDFVSSV